jgi:hypothetical protein
LTGILPAGCRHDIPSQWSLEPTFPIFKGGMVFQPLLKNRGTFTFFRLQGPKVEFCAPTNSIFLTQVKNNFSGAHCFHFRSQNRNKLAKKRCYDFPLLNC